MVIRRKVDNYIKLCLWENKGYSSLLFFFGMVERARSELAARGSEDRKATARGVGYKGYNPSYCHRKGKLNAGQCPDHSSRSFVYLITDTIMSIKLCFLECLGCDKRRRF